MEKRVLAIETSCDDTSMGIVGSDGEKFWVEDLRAASSVADHQQYGGVVPEIASRKHSEDIIPLVEAIGYDRICDVDAIAVTTHPGLPGSLTVGKAMAAMVGEWFDLPVLPINHIHGHVFSLLLERKMSDFPLPWVVLSVSGGHNDLYVVTKGAEGAKGVEVVGDFCVIRLGGTLDDASGEAFDKVARMLGGPYPGGPRISKQAERRIRKQDFSMNSGGYHFPRVFLGGEYNRWNFSFSGLKGQCHRYVTKERGRKHQKEQEGFSGEFVQEVAYEFQEAVVEILAKKLIKAGIAYDAQTIGIVGGVSANRRLWDYTQHYLSTKQSVADVVLVKPTKMVYCTDNAAMIGVVGLLQSMGV